MERRDFLKSTLAVGIISSTGLPVFAREPVPTEYDLVAVKDGEPDVMYRKGIEALGGIDKFVKPGQTVLVKPNIGWDQPPEVAANTNPILVKAIVEDCLNAGAGKVVVFDHTCNNWQFCYKNSGIAEAVKSAGGRIYPGNDEKDYKQVELPQAISLKKTKVHELLLACDVFINVPVLKNHGSAKLTCAMKNLMGVVWDRGYYHKHDLGQCIADFLTFRKPDLNIVDAYRIMIRNGPRGVSAKDTVLKKQLLISTDIVAIDIAASKIIGFELDEVSHLRYAREMKLGKSDLSNMKIMKLTV